MSKRDKYLTGLINIQFITKRNPWIFHLWNEGFEEKVGMLCHAIHINKEIFPKIAVSAGYNKEIK